MVVTGGGKRSSSVPEDPTVYAGIEAAVKTSLLATLKHVWHCSACKTASRHLVRYRKLCKVGLCISIVATFASHQLPFYVCASLGLLSLLWKTQDRSALLWRVTVFSLGPLWHLPACNFLVQDHKWRYKQLRDSHNCTQYRRTFTHLQL
jgi:hypothetical protein